MTVLTLHQGDAAASFGEHPIETARRALIAAADGEPDRLAHQLVRFAEALPERAPVARAEALDGVTALREAAALLNDYMTRCLPRLEADDPWRSSLEELAARFERLA